VLGETDATAGKQLKLTVDIDLQIAAEEALEGQERRRRRDGPAYRGNFGDGESADLRSQGFSVKVSRDQSGTSWSPIRTSRC
jgi:cell division protein FtsI/penicillin-binding protein 2